MAAAEVPTYQETEEILKQVVEVFSPTDDVQAVRDSGRAITDLHAITQDRHREMLDSIKGAHIKARSVSCAEVRRGALAPGRHAAYDDAVDAVAQVITYLSTCCAQKKQAANARQTRNSAVSQSSSSLFWTWKA